VSVDPSQRPRVVVVLLTWLNYDLARACLESLLTSAAWPFPVVVIDNGSGTGEGARLAAEFGPPVDVVTRSRNDGVAAGYNAGLAWAQTAGADYVLLLNNDTLFPDPSLIPTLVGDMDPSIAVSGPLVMRPDGSLQTAGGRMRWWTGRAQPIERDEMPSTVEPYDVDWVDGSCMLVATDAVHRVGPLSEDYFLYWDEVDWATRFRRAGLRCIVDPRTTVVHLGSATVGDVRALPWKFRSRTLFMRRNGSPAANATAFISFIFLVVPKQLYREGLDPRRWLAVLRAAAWALIWNARDARRRGAWLVGRDSST
jgi:hypothetical protein